MNFRLEIVGDCGDGFGRRDEKRHYKSNSRLQRAVNPKPVRAVCHAGNSARRFSTLDVWAWGKLFNWMTTYSLKYPSLRSLNHTREAENQRYRELENQRLDDLEEREEWRLFEKAKPRQIQSIEEAVQYSLEFGAEQNSMFHFARALQSYELFINRRLSEDDLQSALNLWFDIAWGGESPDARLWFWRLQAAYEKVKTPLGSNPLESAIAHSGELPLNPSFDDRITRLKAVCAYLQAIAGDDPFFLGRRDAGRVLEMTDPYSVQAIMRGLEREGFLKTESKGTAIKAARYRLATKQ